MTRILQAAVCVLFAVLYAHTAEAVYPPTHHPDTPLAQFRAVGAGRRDILLNRIKERSEENLNLLASLHGKRQDASSSCSNQTANPVTAPYKNVFGLPSSVAGSEAGSKAMLKSVETFMLGQKSLNLTKLDATDYTTPLNTNYIWIIEMMPVRKSDALKYLSGQNKTIPQQFAKVVVHAGGLKAPKVLEYRVGPLPVSASTKASLLGNFNGATIPYNSRYCDGLEYTYLFNVIAAATSQMTKFTSTVLGGVYLNNENDTLTWSDSSPRSLDGKYRRTWIWFMTLSDGYYLLPTGLSMLVDHSGTDVSKWKVITIVYNRQMYKSVSEFNTAYKNGKIVLTPIVGTDTDFATRILKGAPREFKDRATPRLISRDGPRLSVDPTQNYISWQGWEMYATVVRDSGIKLWNIKFKGENIAHELSLQEASATYSGSDPIQASTNYLDSSWGIGSSVYELMEGYDCPEGAVMLNVTMFIQVPVTRMNAICVYETATDIPISRHFDRGTSPKYSFYGSTKGTALVVRTISSVWNYDYIFDYMFYLDGTMQIKVAASGYMQGAFWSKDAASYGTQVGEFTMGSVHTHAMNYKIDLDILGTSNSLLDTKIGLETIKFPYFDESIIQKKLFRSYIKNENAAAFKNMATDVPHIYTVVNPSKANKFGNPRGYRLLPVNTHNYLHITQGNLRIKSNANWGRYVVAVTKYKETELQSSCSYNQNLPTSPLINFDAFVNNESIEKQDLVVWATLGMHHVPRAEDVPNTLTTSSEASFILTPFNFFNDDGIRDVTQATLVKSNSESDSDLYNTEFMYSSAEESACQVDVLDATPKFSGLDVLG